MPVGSIVELYTTILAWTIYDALYAILSSTGVMLIPFCILIVKTMLEAYTYGDRFEVRDVVKQLEVQVAISLVVLMLAFSPTIAIFPAKTHFAQSHCIVTDNFNNIKKSMDMKYFGDTNSRIDASQKGFFQAMIGNSGTPTAPLWWYVITSLSQAITQAAIQELPCQGDLRSATAGLANMNLADPKLSQELKDFYKDCWLPSANKYAREHPTPGFTQDVNQDVSWAGSQLFQNKTGYYDTFRTVNAPKDLFPYDPVRDENKMPADANDGSGNPTCAQWWAADQVGLRGRILDDLQGGNASSNCDDCSGAWIKYWFNRIFKTKSQADDALIKTSLTSSNATVSNLATTSSLEMSDHKIAQIGENILAWTGMTMKSVTNATETQVYREAAPVVQAILILVFIAVLPILMVISMYDVNNLMQLSVALFTLIFWGFLFALAAWIDNFLLSGVLSSGDEAKDIMDLVTPDAMHSPTAMVISWVGRATYIVLPVIFAAFMGIIGHRLAVGGLTQSMAVSASSAGGSGVGAAGKMLGKAGGKGK